MGVEVVAGLQVGGNEQYATGVRVVRRGPVCALPEEIAQAGRGGADVDVGVVPVYPPALQHPLHVTVVPGAADVVHDLLASPVQDRFSYPRTEGLEHLVPGGALPLVRAARALALHRVEHAVRGPELVHYRHALGAQASPTCGVHGIALDLCDLSGLFVDVGEQPARRFAVEADRRDEPVVAFGPLWPSLRVVLDPVRPLVYGRVGTKPGAGSLGLVLHLTSLSAVGHVLARDHETPLVPQQADEHSGPGDPHDKRRAAAGGKQHSRQEPTNTYGTDPERVPE